MSHTPECQSGDDQVSLKMCEYYSTGDQLCGVSLHLKGVKCINGTKKLSVSPLFIPMYRVKRGLKYFVRVRNKLSINIILPFRITELRNPKKIYISE